MRTDSDSLAVAPAVDDRTVYSIVLIALIVVAGFVLVGLVSILPGLETLLGDLPVGLSALFSARRMSRSVDPIAELVTQKLMGWFTAGSEADGGAGVDGR